MDGQSEEGETWLWRKYCLEKVKKAFQFEGEKGSGIDMSQYTWCLTKEAEGLTMAGRSKSISRRGGLLYMQFYGMIKRQFDSAKHYPWAQDDDMMAMMALDDDYREALQSVIGAKRVDLSSMPSVNSEGLTSFKLAD